jgi:hypothetical protein
MPFQYSVEEKLERILIYGACHRNAVLAAATYAERFPERPHPEHKIFTALIRHVLETESLEHKKKTYVNPPTTHEVNQVVVINMVENNPHISTRQISTETGISQFSVRKILENRKYHPFHIELHQEVHGDDFENRLTFCRWAEGQITENEYFQERYVYRRVQFQK